MSGDDVDVGATFEVVNPEDNPIDGGDAGAKSWGGHKTRVPPKAS